MVGMMGAGKTAVGQVLARKLAVPFMDSDKAMVEAANATIAEIFERDGEVFFRARETEVLRRLLDDGPAVISTGGGAFMSETNRAIIAESGVSVLLNASLELLWERVRHKTTRPLLMTDDPYTTLSDIFKAREPIYSLAQLSVDAKPEYSIEDTAEKVIEALIEGEIIKEGAL